MMNIGIDELQKIHAEAVQNGNTELVREIEGMGAFKSTTPPQNALSAPPPVAALPASPPPAPPPNQFAGFIQQYPQADLNKDGALDSVEIESFKQDLPPSESSALNSMTAALVGGGATGLFGSNNLNEAGAQNLVNRQVDHGNLSPNALLRGEMTVGSLPNNPTANQAELQNKLSELMPQQKQALDNAERKVRDMTKAISGLEAESKTIPGKISALEKKKAKIPVFGKGTQGSGKKLESINFQLESLKDRQAELSKKIPQGRKIIDNLNDRIAGNSKFNYAGDYEASRLQQNQLSEGLENPSATKGKNYGLIGTGVQPNQYKAAGDSIPVAKVRSDESMGKTAEKQAHYQTLAKQYNFVDSNGVPVDSISTDGLIDEKKLVKQLETVSPSIFARYKDYFVNMTKERFMKLIKQGAVRTIVGSLAGYGVAEGVNALFSGDSDKQEEIIRQLNIAIRADKDLKLLK